MTQYLPGKDKVVFCNGHALGVRKDLNGVLLFDSALQTPVDQTEDVVKVEIPLPEVSSIFTTCGNRVCLQRFHMKGYLYMAC